MHLPHDLQIYIMKYVILCQVCDKFMIDENLWDHKENNRKDVPIEYWNGENGIKHVICHQCWVADQRVHDIQRV